MIPLAWEIESNVNAFNHAEQVGGPRGGRWSWYGGDANAITNPKLSTASASYRMQGQCDPSLTDDIANRTAKSYYPGCTAANNDLSTGGAVKPTDTNEQIVRKASDISFLLKPLYESHEDVRCSRFWLQARRYYIPLLPSAHSAVGDRVHG
jgi:hypothetical protein